MRLTAVLCVGLLLMNAVTWTKYMGVSWGLGWFILALIVVVLDKFSKEE